MESAAAIFINSMNTMVSLQKEGSQSREILGSFSQLIKD